METLLKDLRYAFRLLRKNPGFTAVAVASLALAIGANTTIFTVVNAALLRPLPVEEPEQLARLFTTYKGGPRYGAVSYPDYVDYRDQNQVFSGLLAQRGVVMSMLEGEQAEMVNGVIASGNYFTVLGVPAARGRTFLPEEDKTPGSHPVAVVGHNFWVRRFGANPSLVGRTLTLNGRQFTVIGITPEGFTGTEIGVTPDVWVPTMMQDAVRPGAGVLNDRGANWLNLMGRLKPGVSASQAKAAMDTLSRNLAEEYSTAQNGRALVVYPGAGHPEMQKTSVPLASALLIIVGLVLVIACANLATLLLARADARRHEIGLRLALGASRKRLIRQLLTESILMSLAGGLLGLLMAYWVSDSLLLFLPQGQFAFTLDLSLDRRVLAFTLLVSVIAGIAFGLAPALQTTKSNLVDLLKKGSKKQAGGRSRLSDVLVTSQVALSLLLLINAGLFLRSLSNAQSIDPGFDVDKVLVMSLIADTHAYTEATGQVFYHQLEERVGSMPGVESASLSEKLFGDDQQLGVSVDGYTPPPDVSMLIDFNVVGTKYFQTMGIPLSQGRDFTAQDKSDGPGVVIINETMAKRFWPGENAVGKRVGIPGANGLSLEVVGVAKNAKYYNLQEKPMSFLYLPLSQNYESKVTLNVRTVGDPKGMLTAVRREIETVDKVIPVYGVKTMEEHLGQSLWAARMAGTLFSIFGVMALVLALIGVYGVVAYNVSRRTSEIAIRIALGAQQRQVIRLVLGHAMKLTLIGVVLGLAVAFAITRFASSMLYGMSATDPLTFVAIPLILTTVVLIASFIPARTASKIEPAIALKYD